MKKFTIEEIKKYIESQDSMGDMLYNLSEDNIIEANKPNGSELKTFLEDHIDIIEKLIYDTFNNGELFDDFMEENPIGGFHIEPDGSVTPKSEIGISFQFQEDECEDFMNEDGSDPETIIIGGRVLEYITFNI